MSTWRGTSSTGTALSRQFSPSRKRIMGVWVKSSSTGPDLIPRFHETPTVSERRRTVDSTIPNDKINGKKTTLPEAIWMWPSVPRILTSFQTQHDTDVPLVMSPDTLIYDEPEAVDGTSSQDITKEERQLSMLQGQTMVEDEKPGSGHVWDIYPTMPKHIRRWHKPAPIYVANIPIAPGSLAMNCKLKELPKGWTMYIHPEGKPYYHREAMEPEDNLLEGTPLYGKGKAVCPPLSIVTDSDPRDHVVRKTLEHAHFIARVTVMENKFELPKRCELFIELYREDEEDLRPYAGYYLADHDNQVVFWAASTTINDIGGLKVNPETFANQHLRLQLASQYWSHIECYPIDSNIDINAAHKYLTEQIAFMCTDIATSASSTSPWTESQCQSFLSMLNHCPPGRKTWTVARLTALMMDWQFQNLYGHPAARLDRCHSYEVEVPDIPLEDKPAADKENADMPSILTAEPDTRTSQQQLSVVYQFMLAVLLRIACVLIFDISATHHRALEGLSVDKITSQRRTQLFIDETLKDWTDTSLLATVLWTANMAFLAIPYPIQQQSQIGLQEIMRNTMITASLASTMFSIGSIAIGLLHIRIYRTVRTAEDHSKYIYTKYHHAFGYRPLAIIWRLPFTLLAWSVITFSAAVMIFTVTAANNGTRYLLITLGMFIVAEVALCMWYFWSHGNEGGSRLDFKAIFINWLVLPEHDSATPDKKPI
ncbi:SubName: Full=Uncharacterized protein {ECO:0000313/EMBL:CCA66961.1} [Serendipita indica DSM 11827]|nr:SubName: Full=Uncharacterized protein {ECO:0000313/EMBL:CCA66961.1} [Serendipita indica DSM 11827]